MTSSFNMLVEVVSFAAETNETRETEIQSYNSFKHF